MNKETCEELLSTWLTISAILRNERIVKILTFREVCICNMLTHEGKDCDITATDITERTGMLKSQANKVLNDMESKGLIMKVRNESDKRKINIFITKKGRDIYKKEHEGILHILDQVCTSIGQEKITAFIKDLNDLTDVLKQINPSKE